MVNIGGSSLLNFVMTGGSVSDGRRLSTVATRSRTSWAAESMSRLKLNVAMTNEVPCPEIERSSSMP